MVENISDQDICREVARYLRMFDEGPTRSDELRALCKRHTYTNKYLKKVFDARKNSVFRRILHRIIVNLEKEPDEERNRVTENIFKEFVGGVVDLKKEIGVQLQMCEKRQEALDVTSAIKIYTRQRHLEPEENEDQRQRWFKTAAIFYTHCLAQSGNKAVIKAMCSCDLLEKVANELGQKELRVIHTRSNPVTVFCYAMDAKTGQVTRGVNVVRRRLEISQKQEGRKKSEDELDKLAELDHHRLPDIVIRYEVFKEGCRDGLKGLTFSSVQKNILEGMVCKQRACAEPDAIFQQNNPNNELILVAVKSEVLEEKKKGEQKPAEVNDASKIKKEKKKGGQKTGKSNDPPKEIKQMIALPCEKSCIHLPETFSQLGKGINIDWLFSLKDLDTYLCTAYRYYERGISFQNTAGDFIDKVGNRQYNPEVNRPEAINNIDTIADDMQELNLVNNGNNVPTIDFLYLDNPGGTLCFCNSLVQCFRSSSIRLQIQFSPDHPQGPYSSLATLINSTGKHSSKGIMSHFEGLQNNQQDVVEFYSDLISTLHFDIRNKFEFGRQVTRTCNTCEHVTRWSEIHNLISLMLPQTTNMSFLEFLRHQEELTEREMECTECNGHTLHTESTYTEIPETCSHLVVSIPLFIHENGKPVRKSIITQIEKEEHMYEAQWRLVGAIEHYGTSPTRGHYVAWVRNADGWNTINDDKRPTKHDHAYFNNHMKNMYMLWFDRIVTL